MYHVQILFEFILIADFKNLDDSGDTSFEAESYPATELEYPNANACETCVLCSGLYCFLLIYVACSYYILAPKDPDHYNPIMCLEQSLYTIFECALLPSPVASMILMQYQATLRPRSKRYLEHYPQIFYKMSIIRRRPHHSRSFRVIQNSRVP